MHILKTRCILNPVRFGTNCKHTHPAFFPKIPNLQDAARMQQNIDYYYYYYYYCYYYYYYH